MPSYPFWPKVYKVNLSIKPNRGKTVAIAVGINYKKNKMEET